MLENVPDVLFWGTLAKRCVKLSRSKSDKAQKGGKKDFSSRAEGPKKSPAAAHNHQDNPGKKRGIKSRFTFFLGQISGQPAVDCKGLTRYTDQGGRKEKGNLDIQH